MTKEPAEALLTLKPFKETTFEKDGFTGALYRPDNDLYKGKVLILTGGSDGYYSLTKLIAEQFVKRGLTVFALAYWNQEGLPDICSHIPLESGELAALWLRKQGFEKTGIWGISYGSIFSLLCASMMPGLFSCCVAVSPSCICGQGISKKGKNLRLCEGSGFSYSGKDIDFSPLSFSKKRIVADFIRHREVYLRSCYEAAVSAHGEGVIPVENINGPVMFIAAEEDAMWPSEKSAEYMVKRLADRDFPHYVQYEHYERASHLLVPYKLKSRKMFRVERKYPEKCFKSSMDSFEKTLSFLKNKW